jgi:hypothetical protein
VLQNTRHTLICHQSQLTPSIHACIRFQCGVQRTLHPLHLDGRRHTAHHLASTQRSTCSRPLKLLDTSAGPWFTSVLLGFGRATHALCGIIRQVKGPASLKTAVRGVFPTTAVPLRAHIHFCPFESTPSAVSYRCRPAFSRRGVS